MSDTLSNLLNHNYNSSRFAYGYKTTRDLQHESAQWFATAVLWVTQIWRLLEDQQKLTQAQQIQSISHVRPIDNEGKKNTHQVVEIVAGEQHNAVADHFIIFEKMIRQFAMKLALLAKRINALEAEAGPAHAPSTSTPSMSHDDVVSADASVEVRMMKVVDTSPEAHTTAKTADILPAVHATVAVPTSDKKVTVKSQPTMSPITLPARHYTPHNQARLSQDIAELKKLYEEINVFCLKNKIESLFKNMPFFSLQGSGFSDLTGRQGQFYKFR